ncbi:MAG: hypothetical protein JRI46_10835 [Deltaproteobacteria bacterium]|nr:hypothetical protein [Deltaproteobacteria bacterium]
MAQTLALERFEGRTYGILLLQSYVRRLSGACLVHLLIRVVIFQCHRTIQYLEKVRGLFKTEDIHKLLPLLRELAEKTDQTVQKLRYLQPHHPRLFSKPLLKNLTRIRDFFKIESEALQLFIDPQGKEELYKAITSPHTKIDKKTMEVAQIFARSKINSFGRRIKEREILHSVTLPKDLEKAEKELVKEADIFFSENCPE